MLLNNIENSFNTKSYSSNFSTSTQNISIIKNETLEEQLSVKKIKYQDSKIVLIKYEMIK